MPDLNLADIQGFILRGYAMPRMRHLLLRIDNASGARELLALLAPQVTNSVPWQEKPAFCLNIGLTFGGLQVLGVAQASLDSFPGDFAQGAVARAASVGDVGPSAPENWRREMASADLHAILFITAQDEAAREAISPRVRDLISSHGVHEMAFYDGDNLEGNVAHFGFRDGFAQPNVAGAPPTGGPDPLPVSPGGAFVLGHESQHPGLTYPFRPASWA